MNWIKSEFKPKNRLCVIATIYDENEENYYVDIIYYNEAHNSWYKFNNGDYRNSYYGKDYILDSKSVKYWQKLPDPAIKEILRDFKLPNITPLCVDGEHKLLEIRGELYNYCKCSNCGEEFSL